MIEIRAIELRNKKQREAFVRFPWKVYKDYPNWVPPLLMEERKFFMRDKHPFYAYGQLQAFMAYRNGEEVGRVAAITNSLYDEHHGTGTGFVGFFEAIDDQKVANALFDTAKAWLLERNIQKIQGPASPSSNYNYGVLTEGFDIPPRLMMAYNPPYYPRLFEQYGFHKAMGLLAFKTSETLILENPKIVRGAELIRKRMNIEIRKINMKKLDEEIVKIKTIWNRAWEANWGHVPFTEAEIDEMASGLKQLADPNIILFAYIDGELAGFVLAMPDYNKLFHTMNGRLLPFNWIKLLTQRKRINWLRVLVLGVLPEFRRKGLDVVLYYELFKRGTERGYRFAEGSWILENNDMMVRGMERIGSEIYKRYNVYELDI